MTVTIKISLRRALIIPLLFLSTSQVKAEEKPLDPKTSTEVASEAPKQIQPQNLGQNLGRALSINDLKIEMAESSWKIKPTLQGLTELAYALERYLNESCFGDMLRTLSYQGPPTNPDCIARMDRLLEIYPDNPVATCLRDGIEAQSCSDAYRGQSMKQFVASSNIEDTIDPALRVGLSAQDNEKLRAINETLSGVNKDYQGAASDEEKQKHTDDAMHLYDQALSIACKIVALQLEDPSSGTNSKDEHPAVKDVREKILKIPVDLRADYQNRLITQAEEELAKAKNSPLEQKLILQKIAAIQNPEIDTRPTTQGKLRYRVVLPQCYDLVGKASILVPNLPSATCHRDGWQSPQCLVAVKKWHAYRADVSERTRIKEAQSRPTPGSQISAF